MPAVKGKRCGGARPGSGSKRVYRVYVRDSAGKQIKVEDFRDRADALLVGVFASDLGFKVTIRYGSTGSFKGKPQPESEWQVIYPAEHD